MATLTISKITQRRFILGKQGLYPGRRWHDKAGVAAALRAGLSSRSTRSMSWRVAMTLSSMGVYWTTAPLCFMQFVGADILQPTSVYATLLP